MENKDKDFESLAWEGEDVADELWNEGVCLYCRETNDRKGDGFRICSKCQKKEDDSKN